MADLKEVDITQADYDALEYKDPNTLYCIKEKYDANTIAGQLKASSAYIHVPKIVNGSKMKIGGKYRFYTEWKVEQHFNWFQKLMWKWCFGIIVEDYSEE
jgi:hypothetical protein